MVHAGVTASSDTFCQAEERYGTHTGRGVVRRRKGLYEEWQEIGVMDL